MGVVFLVSFEAVVWIAAAILGGIVVFANAAKLLALLFIVLDACARLFERVHPTLKIYLTV